MFDGRDLHRSIHNSQARRTLECGLVFIDAARQEAVGLVVVEMQSHSLFLRQNVLRLAASCLAFVTVHVSMYH